MSDLIKEGEILGQIDWKKIPGCSPHMNGFAEAVVRSTKRHLFHAISKQIFTVDQFFSVTIRIEAILNSRPLIIIPHEDDVPPITLAMAIAKPPLIAAGIIGIDHLDENKEMRHRLVENIDDSFWQRWKESYLASLCALQK
jgi:hypothetical protein